MVLEELNLFPETLQNQSHFLFLNFGDNAAKSSFKKLSQIRDRGIPCEFYPKEVKLKKQMNYADQRNIPFVIMIGPEEIKNDIFMIKDMRTGDQSKHSISSITSILEKLSQSV
jgi:histidyl-tRNA synthetase